MDIRFLGHAAFELSDGDTKVLIDPFLSGNPKAAVEAGELEPTTILLTHGHVDHLGDTVDIAKRAGAPVVAIVEPRRHRRVRLGLGAPGPGVAHGGVPQGHRARAGRPCGQLRRQDDLPPR
jgi:L-ascorbate metabolism protein UlaG (beta-lactamase superfamily)